MFAVVALPAWGGESRQLCLSCHPVHYRERGSCSRCHRGNPASERKNIAHAGLREGKYSRFTLHDDAQSREGQLLLDLLACRRCHISNGRGNRLAGNLDGVAARKTAAELALSIRQPVANMPDFMLAEKQMTLLINTLFAGAQEHTAEDAAPVKVHFSAVGRISADVFSTKCGACHRLLSQRRGALGSGRIGPNLSGLFTEYYPKTFRNGEEWTPRNLAAWVKNPREIRPSARMQPVVVTETEMKELESILLVTPK